MVHYLNHSTTALDRFRSAATAIRLMLLLGQGWEFSVELVRPLAGKDFLGRIAWIPRHFQRPALRGIELNQKLPRSNTPSLGDRLANIHELAIYERFAIDWLASLA